MGIFSFQSISRQIVRSYFYRSFFTNGKYSKQYLVHFRCKIKNTRSIIPFVKCFHFRISVFTRYEFGTFMGLTKIKSQVPSLAVTLLFLHSLVKCPRIAKIDEKRTKSPKANSNIDNNKQFVSTKNHHCYGQNLWHHSTNNSNLEIVLQ